MLFSKAFEVSQRLSFCIQGQRQHDNVFPNAWTKLLSYGLEHRRRTRANPSTAGVEELQNDAFVANELAHPRWPDVGLQAYIHQAINDLFKVIDRRWCGKVP
jgi:hypothetical protein